MAQDTQQEETYSETGHAEADGIGAVAGQFGLKTDIFIAQLINFAIVLIVLWKWAYKPIMKALDDREKKIEESVKQANAIEERVKAIETEKDQIITTAKKEAQTIIEKAHGDQEKRREEMVEAAKREVERVITKGKAQLDAERQAMLKEVRKEIVGIITVAVTKIAEDAIDEKRSQSLAEEIVRKMT